MMISTINVATQPDRMEDCAINSRSMDELDDAPPQAPSVTANADKLSGQLIIKAQLGDDIRKMMIHNEDLTLNELVLMMERIFAGKISNSDQLTIKYLDDDGDQITLSNDSDLTVALHFHKQLRLFVCVNGAVQPSASAADQQGDFIDSNTFRKELQSMRDAVQTILDRLQLPTDEVSDATARESDVQKTPSVALDPVQFNGHQVANHEQPAANAVQAQPTEVNPTSAWYSSAPAAHNEQVARTNAFGPPPTTFPSMSPAFSNAAATYTSPPPAQPAGFYSQQQSLYQQRPSRPSYPANPVYPPQTAYYNPAQQYRPS